MGVYFNIKCKMVLEDFFLSSLIIEGNLKIYVHILVGRGGQGWGGGGDGPDAVPPAVCVEMCIQQCECCWRLVFPSLASVNALGG